jgi:hypothetical protein
LLCDIDDVNTVNPGNGGVDDGHHLEETRNTMTMVHVIMILAKILTIKFIFT